MRWWSVVAAALVVAQVVEGARILMMVLSGNNSHKIFFMSIAEALAARNHTVTYLTGIKTTKHRTNIHEVFVPDVNLFANYSKLNIFEINMMKIATDYIARLPKTCVDALASKEVQKVQEEEFDLVMMSIIGMECFYPYIYKLQVPFIHLNPNVFHGTFSEQSGNPFFSSITPNIMLDLEYPLTFTGRMLTALVVTAETVLVSQYVLTGIEEECWKRNLWPEDSPSLADIRINSSLFITNVMGSLNDRIIPYVPTVIHAGGIHCHPAQPLTQELEEWVAGAGDAGFIFFSLGSNVKASLMPEKHQAALLRVFASLEQRVLWKWEEDTMKDLPPNVRLAKWLPQQDILGDPRLRLFITHGGLMSIQEATYHGVPVLGLSIFMDQHLNMREVERIGWGRRLLWDDLTFDTLRQGILDVMNNASLKEKVLRRSALMRDQPMPTEQWVTYWVEYVLRHKGAPHLRCPAVTMPWYQLYNVDVWLVVVMVVVVVGALAAFLTFKLLLAVWSFLSSFRKRKQD